MASAHAVEIRGGGTVPFDLYADAGGLRDYGKFFNTHTRRLDALVFQADGGDPFGQRLHKVEMALRRQWP